MPFTHAYTGSNPVRVTIKWRISSAGRASALQAEGRRFEPVILHHKKVLLAQLVEHLTFNQRVRGSSPLQDTILKNRRVPWNKWNAWVAELVDAQDLKSCGWWHPCRFDSGPRHQLNSLVMMARRSHLFPYRTQKLSSLAPRVVRKCESRTSLGQNKHASIAQLVRALDC